LIVIHYIPQMIAPAVMRLAHTHGVVREVDIAIIAWKKSHISSISLPILLAVRPLFAAQGVVFLQKSATTVSLKALAYGEM
jgi:hypothetical protein